MAVNISESFTCKNNYDIGKTVENVDRKLETVNTKMKLIIMEQVEQIMKQQKN